MPVDMEYDGQTVRWSGVGAFKATSGLPRHQVPDEQCLPDAGPVPEGLYKLFLVDLGVAQDDGSGSCALKPAWGIQQIPSGTSAGACDRYWANWGRNRVRMEPADEATRKACPVRRGGFYMHDSTKGFSHGCIEIEGRVFPLLRARAKAGKTRLVLKVRYVAGSQTNGGTGR